MRESLSVSNELFVDTYAKELGSLDEISSQIERKKVALTLLEMQA